MSPEANALATQQSVDQAIWSICDVMRRGNCAGALQYVPELTWILFLRILDEREEEEQEEAQAVGASFRPSLESPYRWRDWAAPEGAKRRELQDGALGAFFGFVNGALGPDGRLTGLLPYLKSLRSRPDATPRQKVISEVMSGVERVRIDTERNLLDVLDRVHAISTHAVDPTHVFPLSQVYEGLLLKMGEKGNDGGQFFTPREVIRAMVQVVSPKSGDKVYDPCCGTGGFLAQCYQFMEGTMGQDATAEQVEELKRSTFWGREKENLVYPIALANLVLPGIDRPNIWHGNTLTGHEVYGGLFEEAPPFFDVILTNPPFGGKEGKAAQTNFDYKTSSTQALFLQHVMRSLRDGGRCGIVLDEGLLFRTNEDAFVKTKRKLLDDCNLWCVVSLPVGVFTAAGAGVKTNLLFFTKGERTTRIWYYDLTDLKIRKRTPLKLEHFDELLELLPEHVEGERSWFVDIEERRAKAAEEARPFKEDAAAKDRQAQKWKERARELRKAKPRDDDAISAAKEKAKLCAKEARALLNKAKQMEDAVYDLKAVNPNKVAQVDTRTPDELLDIIEEQGLKVAEALAALRPGQYGASENRAWNRAVPPRSSEVSDREGVV